MPQNRSPAQGGVAVEPGVSQAEVQEILDRLAEAVTTGNGSATTRMWAVPALVISDAMVRPIDTLSEVEQFFSGAKFEYDARGITGTRAEIADLTWPTSRIAIVAVRWPWLDRDGREMADEMSTYVFRRDDAGHLRIQSVIMHAPATDT
ncbi:MAG TPA: hypothetical protein VGP87_10330 [Gemmatimonadales bacterium]|jgi:hypothetical protein|nr:hypothetical protein [Gemmatimonadales bacterium]